MREDFKGQVGKSRKVGEETRGQVGKSRGTWGDQNIRARGETSRGKYGKI